MSDILVENGIYWAGVNDRTTDLFEGLWPISGSGISYNSYIIKDEKTVLVDLAKAIKTDDFFKQISEITDITKLDYVIINHMEPDHTGVINILLNIAENVEIICTPKAKGMLKDYYGIENRIRTVEDGEVLNIGKRDLQFIHIPFVHWPETMATYDQSTNVLFSCDAFGGYGALQGVIFDGECNDLAFYEKEALRYYANIISKFTTPVLKAIDKLEKIKIKTIAPSHGLIWNNNPQRIISLYKKWSEYTKNVGEASITLLYGSMYGNTETMMNAVAEGIASVGIKTEIFDVARTHVSYILPAILVNKGLVIGAPTYEAALFPYMQEVLDKAVLKNLRNKTAVYFGSYGWSKGAYKEVCSVSEKLGWQCNEGFEFPGAANNENMKNGHELGLRFANLIKNDNRL